MLYSAYKAYKADNPTDRGKAIGEGIGSLIGGALGMTAGLAVAPFLGPFAPMGPHLGSDSWKLAGRKTGVMGRRQARRHV